MGAQKRLARWKFVGGYDSSAGLLDGGDYCQTGSENLLFPQNKRPRAFRGLTALSPTTGGRLLFNFNNTYAALLDNGSTAKGSVFMISAGKTLAYVGSGLLYLTGASLSTAASTTPQLRLLRSGIYTGTGTGPYQFGLAQPDAPALAIGVYGDGSQVTGQGNLTGKLKGTYSVCITRIRSFTGAESNRSLTSAVITASASGQWTRITFPLVDSNGQDRWGVYVTLAGFGSIGPQLFYIEIRESDITASRSTVATLAATSPMVTLTAGTFTNADIGRQIAATGGTGSSYTGYITEILSSTTANVAVAPTAGVGKTAVITQAVDGVLRSIPLEWLDADVVGGSLPPIDNDAPNACWFGFSLQDVTALVGSGGDQTTGVTGSPGNVIEVSRPGFPEAYPADTHLFLPEEPTAIFERAADNYVFIFGANSLCACTYTGGQIPLDLQLVWDNVGILSKHQAVIADGRLYCATGTGLVRMGLDGKPERAWADKISADLESLNPATIYMGYDSSLKMVTVMSGTKMWAFNTMTEVWSTPLNLTTLVVPVTGNIVGGVTYNNRLWVSVLNGSTFSLYTFDSGSGSIWKIYSSWADADTPDFKTAMLLQGAFQQDLGLTNVDFKIFAINRSMQFDLTIPARSWSQFVVAGNPGIVIQPRKLNIKNAYAFAVYQGSTSAGQLNPASGPIECAISGSVSSVRV